MPVLEKSGLEQLASALTTASSHNTHFIITGIEHNNARDIIDFLKENNFHTPKNNTAGDYKFLAIPTPKGEERDRMIKALEKKGVNNALETYQGATR